MTNSRAFEQSGNFIFDKPIVFIAIHSVICTQPCDPTCFILADGIYRCWRRNRAEFSLTQFFYATTVVRKPDISFPVLENFVDVVIGYTVALVIVRIQPIVNDSQS